MLPIPPKKGKIMFRVKKLLTIQYELSIIFHQII